MRGRQPVVETEYTTYAFGREGVKFIERQKESAAPFFLHLAFNAVHCPMDSPPELLERFSSIKDKGRRTYAGMLTAMDEAIGRVLKAVHDAGLDDRTLICFISDNGGPTTRKPERVKQLQAEWDAWWKGIGRNKPQIKVNQEKIENSP